MPAFISLFATRVLGFLFGIGSGVAGIISTIGVTFIAFKFFMLFAIAVVLPLVLYNLSVFIMNKSIEVAFSLIGDYLPTGSPVLSLTGMAGYIANEIYLLQALSIIFTATAVRFILGFIPGFR